MVYSTIKNMINLSTDQRLFSSRHYHHTTTVHPPGAQLSLESKQDYHLALDLVHTCQKFSDSASQHLFIFFG